MTARPKNRERVVAWHLKIGAIIDETLPTGVPDPGAEIEALHMALLELGVTGVLSQHDQAETLSIVNETLYDIFDAQEQPDHWRHREQAEMIEVYKQVRRELNPRKS